MKKILSERERAWLSPEFIPIFFIFRISKCQPSFSKVDLPTKKAILLLLVLLLFYFHYCPGSLSWVQTKQCWSRVHCWYPVTGVLHAGQYRGKHRETLCEHCSYATSQVLPGISPAPVKSGKKMEMQLSDANPTAFELTSWNPGAQVNTIPLVNVPDYTPLLPQL